MSAFMCEGGPRASPREAPGLPGPAVILVRAIQDLSLARDVDAVARVVRAAARRLAGADGATFVLRDGALCHYVDEDAIAPLWKGRRFPLETCISGWVMLHGRSTVIEDIYQDPRIPADAYRPTFVKSLAMVPIRSSSPIGAIGNYWAARHAATEAEVSLLQTLADSTSVAMENVSLLADLEKRVRERTEDLEAFGSSVSHDLRAPLRAIGGFAGILLQDHGSRLDEEGRRLLGVVCDQTVKMGRLIDDLLAFSRAGRQSMTMEDLDMTGLARSAFEEAAGPGGRPEFRIEPLPPGRGDRALLRQVWINLLSNAIKYSRRKDRPVVEVSGSVSETGSSYSVRDNGAGFDIARVGSLFGIFQRLHTDQEFEGTGVGLALVRRIVERHGGRVWAEGRPGEGALFQFSLP